MSIDKHYLTDNGRGVDFVVGDVEGAFKLFIKSALYYFEEHDEVCKAVKEYLDKSGILDSAIVDDCLSTCVDGSYEYAIKFNSSIFKEVEDIHPIAMRKVKAETDIPELAAEVDAAIGALFGSYASTYEELSTVLSKELNIVNKFGKKYFGICLFPYKCLAVINFDHVIYVPGSGEMKIRTIGYEPGIGYSSIVASFEKDLMCFYNGTNDSYEVCKPSGLGFKESKNSKDVIENLLDKFDSLHSGCSNTESYAEAYIGVKKGLEKYLA